VGSRRLAAVADTGPLIHLAEVGCLPLLAIFEELHIPEGVWREATRPSTIQEVLTFSKRHALTSTEITKFTLDHGLERLQAGERESLLLCRRLAVPALLTDDLAVRRAAKALDLTPVGSLGIITRAHEMSRITTDAAEQYLRALYKVSSLFVTSTIVDLAIERLRS
jgi:predicted nucleic acid-binding protein